MLCGQKEGQNDQQGQGKECGGSMREAVDQQERERQVVAFVRQLRQRVQDSSSSALVTCPAGEK
jgi:hypothetical protein